MTDNTETAPQEEQNEATPGGDPVLVVDPAGAADGPSIEIP